MPHRSNNSADSGHISTPPEDNKRRRFYELLFVLVVLQTHVGRQKTATLPSPEPKDDPSPLDDETLRREFIRHLAYLCNYDTAGDRVTAIVLEGSLSGPITFWFASNISPQPGQNGEPAEVDRMREFLQATLDILYAMEPNDDSRSLTKAQLFAKSVKYSKKKIEKYISELVEDVKVLQLHKNVGALDLNMPGEQGHIDYPLSIPD
jgi:hypothetical protein